MQRKVKPISFKQEKKRIVYSLYSTRSNCHLDDQSQITRQKYLYEFDSFADNNHSLIDIISAFSRSLYEIGKDVPPQSVTQDTPFNKFFVYMVELYHLHDQHIPNSFKDSELPTTMLKDLISKADDKVLMKKILQLNMKMSTNYSYQLKKLDKIHDKLARVRALKQDLKQKYLTSILAIKDQQIRQLYIPNKKMQEYAYKHVSIILTTLHDIQFVKKKYRLLKMQDFLARYQHLWKVSKPKLEKQRSEIEREPYIKRIITSRYTKIDNVAYYFNYEILITLRDLLAMKKEEPFDSSFGLEIMKKLGKALNEHRKVTGRHYPLLHPKYIIINQIQLTVHLSHTSPILSALGLLKTPKTYEQMITFAATPSTYDPFSAPIEHLNENIEYGTGEEIFYNITYGLDNLLKDPRHGRIISPPKFEGNGLTMSEIKQQCDKISEGWRYTMIGSYLLNGSEYHRRFLKPMDSYEAFKNYLRKEKEKYSKNLAQYIQKVLNFDLQIGQTTKTNEFSLSIFNRFLGNLSEDSDLEAPQRFYKIQRIIKKKDDLQKEIFAMISGQVFNTKLNNPKKHLILFYLSLFQSLFHIKMIFEYTVQDYEKCKELAEKFGKKAGLSEFAESKDQKSLLEKSSNKFKDYRDKVRKDGHKETVEALKYLERTYSLAYRSIEQKKKEYYELRNKIKDVLFNCQAPQRQQARGIFSTIINQANALMKQCQSYIIQIVEKQLSFPKHISQEKVTKTIIEMSSFHVKLNLFLTITRQNFLALESLVFPLINIEKRKNQTMQAANDESFEFNLYALELLKQYQIDPVPENASQNKKSQPMRSESQQISLQQ